MHWGWTTPAFGKANRIGIKQNKWDRTGRFQGLFLCRQFVTQGLQLV
jgi:hypothetical protein